MCLVRPCACECAFILTTQLLNVLVQLLSRGFSALLFLAQAPLQHRGRGRGLQKPAETTTVSIHLSNVNSLITHCSLMVGCAYICESACLCMCFAIAAATTITQEKVCSHLWGSVLLCCICVRYVNHYRQNDCLVRVIMFALLLGTLFIYFT